jgi:pyruvate,water dikinase
MIHSFADLTHEQQAAAGGKGGVLARLARAGYPVPDGFVILPASFNGDELTEAAWAQARARLAALRTRNGSTAFAVRSSARREDAAQASFAGEFETVLDVKNDDDIRRAIQTVRRSRNTKRVQAYSAAQGMDADHEMAVVVQQLIRAQLSGVLFTADPVSGSRAVMAGNFVHGLGDQLVSGEANPLTFTLARPGGRFDGPAELKPFARRLYQLASRLEDDLGGPQDIEWAVADGRLHLLQARPITTLRAHNPRTGEWNDSLSGDYLWTNSNFGEAVPDVMTPLTWSVLRLYAAEAMPFPMPGGHPFMGNVAGRFYMNIGLGASFFKVLGFSRERLNYEMEEFFGHLPEGIEIPLVPISRWTLLKTLIPLLPRLRQRVAQNRRRLPDFVAAFPAQSEAVRQRIRAAGTPAELLRVWNDDLGPLFRAACQMLQAGTSGYENAYRPLRHELRKLIGEEDANALLTGLSEGAKPLASLGPVVSLAKVARGEMSRAAYFQAYGHRGPHEFEVSLPRPAEDPAWIEQQLASLKDTDVDDLLAKQNARREAAWASFAQRHPRKARGLQTRLAKAAEAARGREAIRSEIVRGVWAIRDWALHAAEFTGLGDGIFYLYLDEITSLLGGDHSPAVFIPARRETHARYSALPPYPALISGRFDPVQWAADPNRRSDVFDSHRDLPDLQGLREADLAGLDDGLIRGFPGAAGVVEGTVRVLHSAEEGHALKAGEILVTATTNIGWTPLFPRAAAIITDVGAPLSHAAIVARELGLPAVVGCGHATMRLNTGDRVRVNGGLGIVQLL